MRGLWLIQRKKFIRKNGHEFAILDGLTRLGNCKNQIEVSTIRKKNVKASGLYKFKGDHAS